MSTFYEEMAALAQELLAEFGKPLTLRRVVTGDYDPDSGTVPEAPVEYPGTGALFDYESVGSGQTWIPSTLIEVGDKQCLLSPTGMPLPATGDKLVDGADVWQVQNVKAVNPAGTPVLYELQLRR
ncbi:hypothetical protein [Cupriavidus nantongensis]|uniref:Uncharacterized protein n=1 Tax=Cupriavidus nantongensis TaxID=1796606 RepID=A0A142JHW6_9BURK|nr:hypothetical protein [Cupriavidus nantongensis]AMR77678.1 hypothetical protein A2G96_07985 [Cupriavidus nantongensis]